MKTSRIYQIWKSSLVIACLLIGATAATLAMATTARIFVLSAEDWARPRSGEVIVEFNAVRAAVDYWDKTNHALILVRYPGEDSGELWAAELRDWLISLGVPSDYIRLVAGTQAADEIRLVVGDRDELEQ
jgi:hypothetical protein